MSTPTDDAPVRDLPPLRPLLSTPESVTVHGFEATGIDEAVTWWEWLRAIHPETGLWPLVVPADFLTARAAGWAAGRSTPDNARPDNARSDNARSDNARPDSAAPDSAAPHGARPGSNGAQPGGDDPRPGGVDRPTPHIVMTGDGGRPRPLHVAMIPAATGPDVFEVLHFGGFNYCPRPAEHAEIARRWHTRWGADLLAMSMDSLEFAVARPPTTEAEARELAAEFLVYDPEIDNLEATARGLLNSRWWAAWWD